VITSHKIRTSNAAEGGHVRKVKKEESGGWEAGVAVFFKMEVSDLSKGSFGGGGGVGCGRSCRTLINLLFPTVGGGERELSISDSNGRKSEGPINKEIRGGKE